MGLLVDYLTRSKTSLTARDLDRIKTIRAYCFEENSSLLSIEIPSWIEEIGACAFGYCSSISAIYTSSMNPFIRIDYNMSTDTEFYYSYNPFSETKWYSVMVSLGAKMAVSDDGKVLLANAITDSSNGYTIPDTVINLAGGSLSKANIDTNTNGLLSFVIPDSIEIIGGYLLYRHTNLATLTVGSSVRYIGKYLFDSSSTTTVVFRQPAGMYVELPPAGENTGLAYNKSSRNVSIYTDNECIRNYDWATDNVTATFYSLSEAPA